MIVSLGGPLAVNGVVFFDGTVFETKLRAYAADDGRKLWEHDLPYSAHSVPGTSPRLHGPEAFCDRAESFDLRETTFRDGGFAATILQMRSPHPIGKRCAARE